MQEIKDMKTGLVGVWEGLWKASQDTSEEGHSNFFREIPSFRRKGRKTSVTECYFLRIGFALGLD